MTYLGIDLGATTIYAVVGDENGDVLGRDSRPTPQGPDCEAVTNAFLGSARAACADASVDSDSLLAAGIASIGPLDTDDGVVRDPANLPDTVGEIPVVEPLERLVDCPVTLHNDATAGLLGERFDVENPPDDAVYLTLSSGIGAGICVDGSALEGWNGNAGEVGHFTVDGDGTMPCGCGKRGHWEAYCSGDNIPRYARRLHDGEPTSLPLSDESFGAADVFAAAGGDAFADSVLDRVAEWNAHGVATLVHAYAPEVVSVGGRVALENPGVVEGIRDRVPDLVMTSTPDIRLTPLGEEVVVRGALASAVASVSDGGN